MVLFTLIFNFCLFYALRCDLSAVLEIVCIVVKFDYFFILPKSVQNAERHQRKTPLNEFSENYAFF